MNKKIIIMAIAVVVALGVGTGLFMGLNKHDDDKGKNINKDAEKFASEYTQVEKDNLFVYRSMDEILKILDNGTGVVLLGFPSCPWCQAYVPYLNEVAKENGIKKIYYYNILNDRKENTADYQKILEYLGDYVEYDDEGNKRIYAPTAIFVQDGEVVGMNSETAKDTKGFEKPEDYWTDEEVKDLKNDLTKLCEKVKESTCSDCNK